MTVRGSCPGTPCPADFMLASHVVTDDISLARLARTTLCAAERGRLVLADGARGGPAAESVVAVFDDDGEAIILVPRRKRFDAAVRRRCYAALLMEADPEFGVGLTLLGRLDAAPPDPSRCRRVGCAPATGEQVAVAFIVDRVLVSCPYEDVSVMTRTRRPIPLDVYALAEPNRMAVALSRIIPHINRVHSRDVRALAAFSAGLGVPEVIGAELNHLCPLGFGLRWVGAEGGHETRHRFDEPALSVVEIRRRLQGYVGAATQTFGRVLDS